MPTRDPNAAPRAKKAGAVEVTRQTPWEQLPDALTLTEAAAKVGICGKTAGELARVGEFPGARKLGAQWVVSKWRLMAYLDVPTSEVPRPEESPVVTSHTLYLRKSADGFNHVKTTTRETTIPRAGGR